ncbi:MAG: helix-turn-helix transcriptional regulator [Vitreoscilla sp.]
MYTTPSAALEAAAPPIVRAPTHELLAALVDRIECGVLACGPQGELHYANIAAQRELERARMLCVAGDRVCCIGAGKEAWSNALRDAAVRLRSCLVSVDNDGDRMMVALMPVHSGGGGRPAAVVMMGRSAVCSPLGLEMLSNSHGLTFAERRVFRALVGNSTAREIAASHGVSVATVRSQIQAVRDKLGVRSIEALLLRAAEVPPITARH